MRRIRYRVVMSLDGYIAGPNGEADWIPMDPDVDFDAIFRQFDTALIGRKTFDAMVRARNTSLPGMKIFVFSTTLRPGGYPGIEIVSEGQAETVAFLRSQPGKDIWLFGGGGLFQSLLNAGLVDTVEVAIVPVLLGGGIPLLPALARRTRLKLTSQKLCKTGILSLEYAIEPSPA